MAELDSRVDGPVAELDLKAYTERQGLVAQLVDVRAELKEHVRKKTKLLKFINAVQDSSQDLWEQHLRDERDGKETVGGGTSVLMYADVLM